jgi:transcriptional regulator GlxA family with amidase domain
MNPRIKNFTSVIEQNYHEDVYFIALAAQVNLSASRLRHLFKSETGVSLKSFYAARIKSFQRLLYMFFKNAH